MSGAHNPERIVPIVGLCNGIFTDCFLDEFYKTWVAVLNPKGSRCPCGTCDWFRGKIDLKKELSRWKRRYTSLSRFYAPGSWAPGSVNVDDFNFSRPYVVNANKHIDFHKQVVILKEDFWMSCKFDWHIWTPPLACRTEVWTTEFPKVQMPGKGILKFRINWPIEVCSNNRSLETCNQVPKVQSVSKKRW